MSTPGEGGGEGEVFSTNSLPDVAKPRILLPPLLGPDRFDIMGENSGMSSAGTGLETATDATGYFRVCGTPAGPPLTAQVVVGEGARPPFEFRVKKGEVKELNLIVPKP